jgi:RHS repeat-associated protein
MTTYAALGGLVSMGARDYLPSLGRWLSADSIVPRSGDPQAFNRYGYARNNPLGRIDPTGHADCKTGGCPKNVLPKVVINTQISIDTSIRASNKVVSPLPANAAAGEWHAPMSLPEPYTVKLPTGDIQTSVGTTLYQADQVAYAVLPTGAGVTIGGGVSAGITPIAGQVSSNVAIACNWRSWECDTFSGYQFSAGPAVAEGVSGNFDAGFFGTWGNSDLSGVAGPNNILSASAKVVPGIGGNGTVSWSQSVDEKTQTLAVDKNSGYRINTVGFSAGPSFGANVEFVAQASPAYLPGLPWALNNTFRK